MMRRLEATGFIGVLSHDTRARHGDRPSRWDKTADSASLLAGDPGIGESTRPTPPYATGSGCSEGRESCVADSFSRSCRSSTCAWEAALEAASGMESILNILRPNDRTIARIVNCTAKLPNSYQLL